MWGWDNNVRIWGWDIILIKPNSTMSELGLLRLRQLSNWSQISLKLLLRLNVHWHEMVAFTLQSHPAKRTPKSTQDQIHVSKYHVATKCCNTYPTCHHSCLSCSWPGSGLCSIPIPQKPLHRRCLINLLQLCSWQVGCWIFPASFMTLVTIYTMPHYTIDGLSYQLVNASKK